MLASIDTPVSASRIWTELGLPRSTTYQLLHELTESGFVVHLPEHQTYGLGLVAYSMANAYTSQQPLVRMVSKPLEKVAEQVRGSGHLSRLSGSEIIYLAEARAPGAVSLVTEVGVRLQALHTASGRAMLAHLPPAEIKAIFARGDEGAAYSSVKAHLVQVRKRGWEQEVEEVSPGQGSLAVPVVDHVGRPAAALAVTFPVGGDGDGWVPDAMREKICGELHEIATMARRRMYGESQDPS